MNKSAGFQRVCLPVLCMQASAVIDYGGGGGGGLNAFYWIQTLALRKASSTAKCRVVFSMSSGFRPTLFNDRLDQYK